MAIITYDYVYAIVGLNTFPSIFREFLLYAGTEKFY